MWAAGEAQQPEAEVEGAAATLLSRGSLASGAALQGDDAPLGPDSPGRGQTLWRPPRWFLALGGAAKRHLPPCVTLQTWMSVKTSRAAAGEASARTRLAPTSASAPQASSWPMAPCVRVSGSASPSGPAGMECRGRWQHACETPCLPSPCRRGRVCGRGVLCPPWRVPQQPRVLLLSLRTRLRQRRGGHQLPG